jgi:hypothetical protein
MSDEWYTPKHIFDSLGVVFDLDVATPCNETIYTPHIRRYCPCQDGLSKEWGGLVWMNPPYSKVTPWMNKWLDHGNGIALVPTAKSKWYGTLWESEAGLISLPTNIKFHRPNDKPATIFMALTLAGIGDQALEALHQSGLGKVR